MRSWIQRSVELELRLRAEAIDLGIAAALERGEPSYEWENPDGSRIVYDLTDWPRVRDALLERAH